MDCRRRRSRWRDPINGCFRSDANGDIQVVDGLKSLALALLFFSGVTDALAAAAAGRTDFATGDVAVIEADGGRRAIARGAEIHSGETIDTGEGRAQLRMTDGAVISLSRQTRFRIDEYTFSGAEEGSGKGFFSLLKGALRTITGAIGKTDRKSYQLRTAVATIGIRGTEYSVAYGESITVAVGAGAVEVCNQAGCLVVEAGQAAYVKDGGTAPVFTKPPPRLPNAPEQEGQRGFTAGEEVNVINPPPQQQHPPPYRMQNTP